MPNRPLELGSAIRLHIRDRIDSGDKMWYFVAFADDGGRKLQDQDIDDDTVCGKVISQPVADTVDGGGEQPACLQPGFRKMGPCPAALLCLEREFMKFGSDDNVEIKIFFFEGEQRKLDDRRYLAGPFGDASEEAESGGVAMTELPQATPDWDSAVEVKVVKPGHGEEKARKLTLLVHPPKQASVLGAPSERKHPRPHGDHYNHGSRGELLAADDVEDEEARLQNEDLRAQSHSDDGKPKPPCEFGVLGYFFRNKWVYPEGSNWYFSTTTPKLLRSGAAAPARLQVDGDLRTEIIAHCGYARQTGPPLPVAGKSCLTACWFHFSVRKFASCGIDWLFESCSDGYLIMQVVFQFLHKWMWSAAQRTTFFVLSSLRAPDDGAIEVLTCESGE